MGRRRIRRTVFLLVFALVDAAVIYYGVHLRHEQHNTPAPVVTIIPTQTSPVATPTPEQVDQPAAKTKAASPVANPLFGVWDDRTAFRAVGYCVQPSSLIYTENSGASWLQIPQPAPFVIWMHLEGTKSGWVIGADSTCTSATRYTTNDHGLHWTATKSLGHIWIPTVIGIRTPSGGVTQPCGTKHPSPISFSSVGVAGDAVAVCPRGVFRTTNGGKSWRPTGPVTKGKAAGVALTRSGAGVLVMVNDGQCPGDRVLNTSDAGKSWTVGPCLRVASAPIALALADNGGGILTSAGARYLTTDFGGTWD